MAPAPYTDIAARMRKLADQAREAAPGLRLLFVTNLRVGAVTDLAPEGVSNLAQYYSRREADEIIRSLQELGLTVDSFFDEVDFVRALVNRDDRDDPRPRIVYTTAEAGTGSGRRALIPALCNLLGVPAFNSGAHASSLVRHKFHASAVLRRVGVRSPETWQFADGRWTAGVAPPIGSRVIVKPAYESMGIGVDDEGVRLVDPDFESFAADRARRFGQPTVVQEFISGDEVGVPVSRIGSTFALPPVAQRRKCGEPYGSRAKTFHDENVLHDLSHAPFTAPAVQVEALRDAAVLAFDALEMKGAGRIDFRIDADGRAWAFDTNGEPPPLPNTCWSVAMEELGFSLDDRLAVWLGICLLDYGLISGV